jgi:DNA-binding GntR family transcriptional regulator
MKNPTRLPVARKAGDASRSPSARAQPDRTSPARGAAREPRGGAPGLADQARETLEERIITLQLPPGSVWSEFQLSEMVGIGRTPVREALQRLQADHLVRILPRLGAQITEINVTQQLLVLEVRRVLERLIAENAARRATPEERQQLLQMADTLEGMGDSDVHKFLRFHYDIKRYIAACARNPFAASAIASAHAMSRRFYFLHYSRAHDLPVAARHHTNVIRAVALGEEARASAASEALMDYVEQLTRDTVMHRS